MDVVRGIPVTNGLRTAFDGARFAASVTEAVIFIDMMMAAGLITELALARYIAAHCSWNGVGQARTALRLSDAGSRSPQETRLRLLWIVMAGLPRPLVNAAIYTPDSELAGIVDLLDPDAGTVAEYDGEHHRDLHHHAADNRREEMLEGLGLIVTRVTSVDLRRHVDTAQRLRRAWHRGERRDRTVDRWRLIGEQGRLATGDVADGTG